MTILIVGFEILKQLIVELLVYGIAFREPNRMCIQLYHFVQLPVRLL